MRKDKKLGLVEMHVHTDKGSNIRLRDTINKTETLIQKAYDMGLNGIAITEHESLSSHISAIVKNKEIRKKDTDFKVILGNEIYLVDKVEGQEKYFHAILLSKNKIGHRMLRELSSFAWENSFTHKRLLRPCTTYDKITEVVNKYGNHLIFSTACLGSYFSQEIIKFIDTEGKQEHRDNINTFLQWGIDNFGKEDFYIELQSATAEIQQQYNQIAVKIAKAYGLKWIVTNDVHFYTKDYFDIQEAFLKSKDEEREVMSFYENCYLKTPLEMREQMTYLTEEDFNLAVANTLDIYDKIQFYDLKEEVKVPQVIDDEPNVKHLFKDYYKDFEYLDKFAHSEHNQDLLLVEQIEDGWLEKKNKTNSTLLTIFTKKERISRINIELKELWLISEKLGQRMSAYHVLTKVLVDLMWDDDLGDSIVPPGRGSVNGFFTAYLVGITQTDSMKFNLPHWRYLVSERPEIGDIDIDTQANRRLQIANAIKDKYGYDKCLNVAAFKTEGGKSAILTAARGLGIDSDIAQFLAGFIKAERGIQWSIEECLYGNEDKHKRAVGGFKAEMDKYEGLEKVALEIEGLVSGRTIHASGFVIYDESYIATNSMQKAPNGTPTTCWDLSESEYTSSLKLDFLTISAADKIRTALNLLIANNKILWQGSLKATYDKYLHPDVLEYDDIEMWKLLHDGKVADLFQFEKESGTAVIKETKPTNIKDLALSNSLMRIMGDGGETPLERFMRYTKNPQEAYSDMDKFNLNRKEKKVIEDHLEANSFTSCEQEDCMELSMDKRVSGFSVAEANKLRKAIAKKKPKVMQEVEELFFNNGRKLGNRKELLNYVWQECIMPQAG